MICKNCGEKIADDSKFCEFCGKKVNAGKKRRLMLLITIALLVLISISTTILSVSRNKLISKLENEVRAKDDSLSINARLLDSLQIVVSQLDDKIMLVNDDNFKDYIAMSNDRIVIIDFYGKWCKPCRKMDPYLAKLAEDYRGKVIIGRYLVEDFNEKYPRKYDVTAIPTLLFIKNNQVRYTEVGFDNDFNKRTVNHIERLLNDTLVKSTRPRLLKVDSLHDYTQSSQSPDGIKHNDKNRSK